MARNLVLVVAAALIVAGIALWSIGAALIAAGILIGAFVLLTE